MCQAKTSVRFSSVLVWTFLSSLTFGFCSIWCLHFVAMLACELDLHIGINVPLTILSSVLAVFFTFAALASDMLWETYRQGRRKNRRPRKRGRTRKKTGDRTGSGSGSWANGTTLHPNLVEQEDGYKSDGEEITESDDLLRGRSPGTDRRPLPRTDSALIPRPLSMNTTVNGDSTQKSIALSPTVSAAGMSRQSSEYSESRRSSITGSTHGSHGLTNIMNIAHRSAAPAKNAFVATGEALYLGCTRRNIIKGFLWSLAVSGMHYVGIAALRIPEGHYTLNPFLVVLSGLISWVVCLVGVILMSRIESHLAQQFLFSVVASVGVAAMHFTGNHPSCFQRPMAKCILQEWQPSLSGPMLSPPNLEAILLP